MRLTLLPKLVALFLVVALVGAVGSAITVMQVNKITENSIVLAEENLPTVQVTNALIINVYGRIGALRGYVATGDEAMLTDFHNRGAENQKIFKALTELAEKSQDKSDITPELQTIAAKYGELIETKVVPLVRSGKRAEAAQILKDETEPIATAFIAKVEEYRKLRETQITEAVNTVAASAGTARRVSVIATTISVFIGLIIGVFTARAISRPAAMLATAARKVADGNLNAVTNYQYPNDEIGDVATAMRAMIRHLRELIQTIQNNAELVAAASQQLNASSEQSAQAAAQVASAITDVTRGAEIQLNSLEETTAVVEQMSGNIQQIAAAANNLSQLTENTVSATGEGHNAINRAIAQMNAIAAGAQEVSASVAQLTASSKQIGEIVGVIGNIASQTNLLALNAAIEAARAGEHGRGFAVVAEEVRKLAEQSQAAAKEIADLIQNNTANIDKAVSAMNAGANQVEEGMAVVHEAGKTFEAIAEMINKMSGQIQEISMSIREIASGSKQVVDAMQVIDNISKNVVGNSQTVSAAIEEQSASMEEIAASSQSLAKMATDLQDAVRKFTL